MAHLKINTVKDGQSLDNDTKAEPERPFAIAIDKSVAEAGGQGDKQHNGEDI